MVQSIEFISPVTKGHFLPHVRTGIAETLQRMEGKTLAVKLYEPKPYSSDPQRKYYFAVIVERFLWAFREAGNDMDKGDMHKWLKAEVGKLFKEVVTPETGEITRVLRSYRDLNTPETEDYHTKCRARGAELGVDIPEPWEK